ncbi:MAG: dephospho-CoA kinase [Clostridia bacterium]|nr:dephospho-CoA kinase [Clostridia bacterium]
MKKVKIALTGGIGSGKSVALDILDRAGYKTLSSDKIVSELYQKRRVKKLLKSLFPDAVSGFIKLKVDRKKISKTVFYDNVMHKKLTESVTPLVLKEIKKRTKNLNEPVFVEVPLLFECGYENEFDGVLVITRSKDARIESVKKRSNLSEDEIIKRMNMQTDYDSFNLAPYSVIVNDGDLSALKEKVLTIAKELTN